MRISQKNENSLGQKSRQPSPSYRTQEVDCLTYSFPKAARLLSGAQFHKVVKTGNRFEGSSVLVDYRQGHEGLPKLGITVSKRHGKAYLRNRFKRVVREAFRLSIARFPQGLEMNIVPRLSLTQYNTDMVLSDLQLFISRLNTENVS